MLILQEIYDEFSEEKKDISDVGDLLFYRWMTTIASFLYKMKRDMNTEGYILSETYSVSSSPQASALPASFKGLQELGTGVFRVNADGTDSEESLPRTGFGSRQRGYYLDGDDNIVFTGISDGSQYKLRYMPTAPRFTAIEEYFSLDKTITGKRLMEDSNLEYLMMALNVLYSRWDEDVSSEVSADQRFVRAIGFILGDEMQTDSAIALPNTSDSY